MLMRTYTNKRSLRRAAIEIVMEIIYLLLVYLESMRYTGYLRYNKLK